MHNDVQIPGIKETPFGNLIYGELAKGCLLCMQGRKLVVFATGVCHYNCFYCPISLEKRGRNIIFANERQVKRLGDILEEAELMDAEGAGITGGEPLYRFDETINIIMLLKEHFGKDFHIHLYTGAVDLVSKKYKKLVEAGLDELRIHLKSRKEWSFITTLSRRAGDCISVGIEVPIIPRKEDFLLSMLNFLAYECEVEFVNLNELEFSESNALSLLERGFKLRDGSSAAVKGSYETGLRVLRSIVKNKLPLNIHLCTTLYKGTYQTALLYFRRGINVAEICEMVEDNGLLLYVLLENFVEEAPVALFKRVYGGTAKVHVEAIKYLASRPNLVYKIVEETPTHVRIKISET
ncbi:MAG: radical SAM protein [Thermoproteales archaeon]|nr:radical SAM protein [Thermoproteales archaeon]